MSARDVTGAASSIVILIGAAWGLYWIPVRALEDLGLGGAWGTLAIVATAALLVAPVAALRWRNLAGADRAAVLSVLLGGLSFALYSIALLYGRVAIVVILFYLTPIWSTLIGRYVMGWPITRFRALALALGGTGMLLLLGSGGQVPLPRGLGEWLALASGILWSVSSTGIRTKVATSPVETGFLFSLGACIGAGLLVPALTPLPDADALGPWPQIVAWVLAAGGLWWAFSMTLFMWATTKLEPARVGVLLMTEVLVSAVSASLLAGEALGPAEWIGGALVLSAGIAELWPNLRRARAVAPPR